MRPSTGRRGWRDPATLYYALLYAGLLFLVFYLLDHGQLVVPDAVAPGWLLVALALAAAGFLLQPPAWRAMSAAWGYDMSLRESVAGFGSTVFAKYVPGKIWVVMGRAAYSAHRHNWPLSALTFCSAYAQVLTLWIGMSLGLLGLLVVKEDIAYKPLFLSVWLCLSIVITVKPVQDALRRILARRRGARTGSRQADYPAVLRSLLFYVLGWIAWGAGFYALARALGLDLAFSAAVLGFSLAATAGIISVFAPGGLGVREAILAAYLHFNGMDTQAALSLSVSSRLWFLAGEVFIFAAGMYAHRQLRRGDAT